MAQLTRLVPKGHELIEENPPAQRGLMDMKAELFGRLGIGAGGNALFLPSVGEFGHRILTAIRIVHWNKAANKVVCCKHGEEVLYPSGSKFITDWIDPIDDKYRGGAGQAFRWPSIEKLFPDFPIVQVGDLDSNQEVICIHPEQRIPFKPLIRGLPKVDICLGVRNRLFCPEKNWPFWTHLAKAIVASGKTFAVIGMRPTTLDLDGQACHSSDYDTDAVIELLQNCKLYAGTDTGISHLAATIGCKMIVWREESDWNRDLRPCMAQRNPLNTVLMPEGSWWRPKDIISAVIDH